MRPELRAVADDQHGLVTRRQAVQAGYSERELHTLTRAGGEWLAVRRGIYLLRDAWTALDPYEGQMAVRDRAADLAMTRTHILSHDSAARTHGLPLLRPQTPLVHVTRPGYTGGRTDHGVKHHLGRALPAVLTVDGLPVTNLARTALDVAREHGLAAGVVACDAALRRRVPRDQLAIELAQMWCWPGVTRSRAALEYADPGADSPGESLARLLLIEMGFGEVETQFPVLLGSNVAWCDLRVGRHIVEFDGRIKYRTPADGGVARDPDQALWDEKQRQTDLCAEGLGVSRVVWADYYEPRRTRAKERIRAEYAVTLERFGSSLPPHMVEFAARMRGARAARLTA